MCGTATGLFFVAWFASGLVLLFVPFPSLTDAERVGTLEPFPIESCREHMDATWQVLRREVGDTPVERLGIHRAMGRPVYIFHLFTGSHFAVWGDTRTPVDQESVSVLRWADRLVQIEYAEHIHDDQ